MHYNALISDEERFAATSIDIDILAAIDEVTACTQIWNENLSVKTYLSNVTDPSPNSGKATFQDIINDEGDKLEVDFLACIQGIKYSSIIKKRSPVVDIDGIAIRMLHPVLLLQSRLANLYELHYSEQKQEREIIRIKIAGRIVGHYIKDVLDSGQIRLARNLLKEMLKHILPMGYGRTIYKEGVDLLDGLPVCDLRFGKEHLELYLPGALNKINKRRGLPARRYRRSI